MLPSIAGAAPDDGHARRALALWRIPHRFFEQRLASSSSAAAERNATSAEFFEMNWEANHAL
jgi:hypothetical protein